jgi:hypothetical protein
MSSNSIGDLTDFFMALCLMDTDNNMMMNVNDVESGHKEIEKRKNQSSVPSENKRSRLEYTTIASSYAHPPTLNNVSPFMNRWTDNNN